ncbi:ras and EF-hand domain-containing protein [Megalops cyprinoides]|uniref:ras and EF-hand domain-containing protein n=1 Tax=Megalops cyprinoides TaxID=118141 RepID=UPI001864B9E9|nr:ras and EF-hand domain-containing protein [Megalops cyprinoides]
MDGCDLQRLFSACDVNKTGRIEYEDFIVVCQELNVPSTEVRLLFNKFDEDEDGYVDFGDFSARFDEVSAALDLASFGEVRGQRSPWDEFLDRMNGEMPFLGSTRERLAALYQQIYCASDAALLQQYEALIESLESEMRDQHLENQRLVTSLRRLEEVTTRQLTELEEDLQQQLACVEKRVKDEERRRSQATITAMEQRHMGKVADLQATIETLKKNQEESWRSSSRVDVYQLKSQIREMTQENEQLRSSLLKAQGNISVMQTELDKQCVSDQSPECMRENQDLEKMLDECSSYPSHIKVLQEMNKKRHDSNDGLRSALVRSGGSGEWKSVTDPCSRQGVAVPPLCKITSNHEDVCRDLKPVRQSTLNYSSFENEDESMAVGWCEVKHSCVASWRERCTDSGLSLFTDRDASLSSDYDSDDSQDSVETVHHGDSCSSSNAEGLDSAAPSICSSRSFTRRRLSAFYPQEGVAEDPQEEDIPVYRLVLAGDAGSGKSSFLLRLSVNEFRKDMQTTLGVDFQEMKMLVDGEKTNLQIWDTAGQERYRSISRSYFRKAQGVLLLYDVTSETSFLNIRNWMAQIQESAEEHIPMCLIGNKADLRTEQPEDSCVSTAHGERLARMYNALFCETSAKEGTNIVEAVLHLAREVKKNTCMKPKPEPQLGLNLEEDRKLLSCCGI